MATALAAFDPERLLAREFPLVTQTLTPRDCILYALAVGYGSDPTDPAELPFVYEEPKLIAAPSLPVVLASPGFWAREPDSGIDWRRLLHAETELLLHAPLPTEGVVKARTRVTRVIDKGAEKGALVYAERVVEDGDGRALATVRGTSFCRGNGGAGGDLGPQPAPHRLPAGAPHVTFDTPTEPRAALLYRLSGDPNPLHADPAVARVAGFERPILHGLCSFAIAVRAILRAVCGLDPLRLRAVKLRYARPVFPGETVRTEIWREGAVVSFRATVPARDCVVLDHGRAEVG